MKKYKEKKMATYDYCAGKKRIEEILDNNVDVIKQDQLPKESEFTFDNAYQSWVTGLFVDIRESTLLFSRENKNEVSRLIRAFTSEIIEILRLNKCGKPDDNLREIGIRGDCVYAIYTSPQKDDEYEIADKAFYINTFMKMLNALLKKKKLSDDLCWCGCIYFTRFSCKSRKRWCWNKQFSMDWICSNKGL